MTHPLDVGIPSSELRPLRLLQRFASILVVTLLALGSLSGCDRRAALASFVDHDVDAQARRDFDRLAAKDPTIATRFAPEQRTPDIEAKLAELGTLLPTTTTDLHVVGYNAWTVNGDSRYELLYEARRQDDRFPWVLERIRLHRTADGLLIEGMNVQTLSVSLEEINAFTLAKRPPWMLAFLAGMVLVVAFIVVTFIACARERGLARKWAWLLFIAFGAGTVDLNWSNGATTFQFMVSLLGAGFVSAGVAGPWIMKLSFPLGAVVYWVKRRARRMEQRSPHA